MGRDHTTEFLVLIDRYLAGDVDAEEMQRIRELCEGDGSFELEFVRALRFESLVSGTLLTCGDEAKTPQSPSKSESEEDVFEAHPDFLFNYDDEAAADASGIDLLHAGMLSAEDERTLRIDTSKGHWLVDELRDADLLSDMLKKTFREIAGDGPAETFVGADRIDRYLAGDLDTEDLASLFADADDSTTLGVELAEARRFESMMREGFGALESGQSLPPDSDVCATPWIGAGEDLIERYLAGALSEEELLRLESAATNSPSLKLRLDEAKRYAALMQGTFATMAEGKQARVAAPLMTRTSSKSQRARRIRAHANLTRRRQRSRQRTAIVSSLLLFLALGTLAFAMLPDDVGDSTPDTPKDQTLADNPGAENAESQTSVEANNTQDSTSKDAPREELVPTPETKDLVANSGKKGSDNIPDSLPEPVLGEPDKSSGASIKKPTPSSEEKQPAKQPRVSELPKEKPAEVIKGREGGRSSTGVPTKKQTPDERAWIRDVSEKLTPEALAERSTRLEALAGELSGLVDEQGAISEKALLKLAKETYQQFHGISSQRNLAATHAIVLRALMRAKMFDSNWRKERKSFTGGVEAMLQRFRKDSARQLTTHWDRAEVLSSLELWYRADKAGKRHFSLKNGHRALIVEIFRDLRNGQQESGFWGEPNSKNYGSVGKAKSMAHQVGRDISSDIFNTFAAMRGVEAATTLLKSDAPSKLYVRLASGILASQSEIGDEVTFDRVLIDQKGKRVHSEVSTLARGWTITGDLKNAETERSLTRSGAATAAALYLLKASQEHLSKSQRHSIESKLEKQSFADAELGARAWLEVHHMDDANPGHNDESVQVRFKNLRYFYLYAMRKAFKASGDISLRKEGSTALITRNIGAELDSFTKMHGRESLKDGILNWPIRRAMVVFALLDE